MLRRIADGRTDLVFDLLASGQPATASDPDGIRLIAWCAYHGDVSAIRFLLDNGESLDSLGTNLGLAAAAFHGHWALCQFLLERGADAAFQNPQNGESALHAALCKANRPNAELILQLLIAHGAKPDAVTRPGIETGSFMRDCRTRAETPLHRAAAFGSEACVSLLLDAGASPGAKDMNGDSPLAWASWHLRPATILRLLCYDGFTIHPDNASTYDHGTGWETRRGRPHLP